MSGGTGEGPPGGALGRILEARRESVRRAAAATPLEQLREKAGSRPPRRRFADRVREKAAKSLAVIAEIKFASPSAGQIRPASVNAAEQVARQYQAAGAACLSVLTEGDFFAGSPRYLEAARATTELPVLRKDFILDAWQVWETAAMGADALLLIAAALPDADLAALAQEAERAALDVLVEVHSAEELRRVLAVPALDGVLLGINNRDLRSLQTDTATALSLRGRIPAGRVAVAESGYADPKAVAAAADGGIRAFLAGEAMMRQPHPGDELRRLFFAG